MLERCVRFQKHTINPCKSSVVVINNSLPEARGVLLTHTHDLLSITISDKVCLFDGVEEGICEIPAATINDLEFPRQLRSVEVHEETGTQSAKVYALICEA